MNKRERMELTHGFAKRKFREIQDKLARKLVYENNGSTTFNDQQTWRDAGAYIALNDILFSEDKE